MTELVTTINSVHAFNDSQQAVDAKQLTAQLQDSDDTVYLFYSHPSVYVAEQLKQGHNGNTACTDWLNGINTALTVQRKHRRRLRLLCLQDALVHGNELTRQTGLSTDVLTDYDVNPDGLELMAGHQLVLQNDDIMQLIERLEASTLQLSEQAYHVAVDVEAVLLNAQNSAKADAYQQRIQELESENQLLMEQISATPEPAAPEEPEEPAVAPEKIKELEEENELLLLQLQQVQEELEAYFIKYQDAQKDLSKVKQESDKILKQLLSTQEDVAAMTEQLAAAEAYQKKFKTEQQKANQLRQGLANANRELLELRVKNTPKKPVSKGGKVKQKLLRQKPVSPGLPNWLNEQILH